MMWTQDNLACHGIELYSTLSDLSYDVNSPKTEQMNPESLYFEYSPYCTIAAIYSSESPQF